MDMEVSVEHLRAARRPRRAARALRRWPQGRRTRRFVIECKVLHQDPERTIEEGMAQTRGYMDRCGAESGHLIVFDRAPERTWEERIFRRDTPAGGGAPVTVWGM